MVEFMQYATSGFWVFIGHFLLLSLIVKGVVGLVRALNGLPQEEDEPLSSVKWDRK